MKVKAGERHKKALPADGGPFESGFASERVLRGTRPVGIHDLFERSG